MNSFAQAYEPFSHPAWAWLKVLFSDPPAGPSRLFSRNATPDVINISSDDEMIRAPTRVKEKTEIITIDSSGEKSSFNRYYHELGVSREDSDSKNSLSVHTDSGTTKGVEGSSTPTKSLPPSWVGVPPWKK